MTLKILSLAIALLSALVPTLALTGCNSYSEAAPSVNDAAELACARLQQGDLTGARESAEAGIRLARSAQEKAAFFVLIAQTYGIEGKYREAAEAALAGQQIAPTSIELAHVRLEYFSRAGDDAQERAADRHLRSLDPNYKRTPVVDPATGAIIAITITHVIAEVNRHIIIPLLTESNSAKAQQWLEVALAADRLFERMGILARPARKGSESARM